VPAAEGKTRFQDLNLPPEVMHAIADLNFQYCTPIQAAILPAALEGRDAFGKAQTGTGKTAAFLIAMITRFLRHPLEGAPRRGTPRALIIGPTRELVLQIDRDAQSLAKHCGVRTLAVYGGMDYDRQRQHLHQQPVDIVVATPGRLLDFKKRGDIHLNHVEVLVLDEADRMLDMGFIPDVRQIINSTPPKANRQTLFFSATLTDEVKRLSAQWTRDPLTVEIEPTQVAVDTVQQIVYIVTVREKFALLYNILQRQNAQRVIVFANRRDEAEHLMRSLLRFRINCALLSGAVPQEKRLKTLERFRSGQIRVLVATDVAGRGLHVDSVDHVINFNLPLDPEDYVHRIGRTGRAGASGISISFACEDDSFHIPDLEKFLGRPLTCTHPEDEWLKLPETPAPLPGHSEGEGSSAYHSPGGRPPRHGGGGRRGGGRRGGRPGGGSRRGGYGRGR
jgi:ATP-dependent RNA helicase RhlB